MITNTDVTNTCKQIHKKLINEYVKCIVTVLNASDVVHHRYLPKKHTLLIGDSICN